MSQYIITVESGKKYRITTDSDKIQQPDQSTTIRTPSLAEIGAKTVERLTPPISFKNIDIEKAFTRVPNPFETGISQSLTKAGTMVKEAVKSVPSVPNFLVEAAPFTPPEFATQIGQELLVTPVIEGAGKIAGKIFNVSDKAEKLMASALKILPTERTKIAEMAGVTPEKWMLQRGIKGSPEEIVGELNTIWQKSKNTVDNILAKSESRHNFKQAGQALDELENLYKGTAGNEQKLFQIASLKNKIGEGVMVEGKRGLTLSELNETKRLLDGADLIFKKSGEIKSGATSEGLSNIRKDIKGFIEDVAKKEKLGDIKALNKETQVAFEIGEAIADKQIRQMGNNIFNLTDIIAGTVMGASFTPQAGLATTGILVAKKIAENPKFKMSIATALQRLSGEEFKVLQSGFKTEQGQRLVSRVINTALRQSGIEIGKEKLIDKKIKVPELR